MSLKLKLSSKIIRNFKILICMPKKGLSKNKSCLNNQKYLKKIKKINIFKN